MACFLVRSTPSSSFSPIHLSHTTHKSASVMGKCHTSMGLGIFSSTTEKQNQTRIILYWVVLFSWLIVGLNVVYKFSFFAFAVCFMLFIFLISSSPRHLVVKSLWGFFWHMHLWWVCTCVHMYVNIWMYGCACMCTQIWWDPVSNQQQQQRHRSLMPTLCFIIDVYQL